ATTTTMTAEPRTKPEAAPVRRGLEPGATAWRAGRRRNRTASRRQSRLLLRRCHPGPSFWILYGGARRRCWLGSGDWSGTSGACARRCRFGASQPRALSEAEVVAAAAAQTRESRSQALERWRLWRSRERTAGWTVLPLVPTETWEPPVVAATPAKHGWMAWARPTVALGRRRGAAMAACGLWCGRPRAARPRAAVQVRGAAAAAAALLSLLQLPRMVTASMAVVVTMESQI
ncbi:hypothetical protein HK405_001979, partial [Cladochytrium tenue]